MHCRFHNFDSVLNFDCLIILMTCDESDDSTQPTIFKKLTNYGLQFFFFHTNGLNKVSLSNYYYPMYHHYALNMCMSILLLCKDAIFFNAHSLVAIKNVETNRLL